MDSKLLVFIGRKGGRDDVTDRKAVVMTGGLEDGLKDRWTN
jgi:hypothetical protein